MTRLIRAKGFFRIVLVLFLVVVFRPHHLRPQDLQTRSEDPAASDYTLPDGILGFAYSLFAEGDYSRAAGEFQRFRFLFPERRPDRIFLMIGMSYQRAGYLDKALEYFRMVGPSDKEAENVSVYESALTFLLMKEYEQALRLIRRENPVSVSELYNREIISAVSCLFLQQWDEAERLLGDIETAAGLDLQRRAEIFRSFPRKSPVLAGILSAFVPGLGKMYAERWRDGLFSFAGIGAFAGLAVYSFVTEGTASVKAWVYTALGGLFHIGNIYGAVVAARDFNSFQRQRMEEELFGFIYSHY
jgi:tetratricopeptide (TPR) repeat protein